jgi:hypothetical protein
VLHSLSCLQAVDPEEVVVAYGRRQLPKLLAVLSLSGLSADKKIHCLHTLRSVCTTQEQKAEAVALGAPWQIISCITTANCGIAEAACLALEPLVSIMDGQLQVFECNGVKCLTSVLPLAPVAAARCLVHLAGTLPGAQAIFESDDAVIPAIANTCKVCPVFCCMHKTTMRQILSLCEMMLKEMFAALVFASQVIMHLDHNRCEHNAVGQ